MQIEKCCSPNIYDSIKYLSGVVVGGNNNGGGGGAGPFLLFMVFDINARIQYENIHIIGRYSYDVKMENALLAEDR